MTAPRRTQEERREATREALIAAALSLFAERGVEATTQQDVSERAGFTKGALFHHFDNKDALVDAALARAAELLERAVSDAWDPSLPALPRVRRAATALASLALDHRDAARVFASLSLQGAWDARLGALARPRWEHLARLAAEGLSLTLLELGADCTVPVEAVASQWLSAGLGASLRPDASREVLEAHGRLAAAGLVASLSLAP